jgi:hypothetical protein
MDEECMSNLKKKSQVTHLECVFIHGKKCQNNVFLNFCIVVDEVCVLLGYDAVSRPKRADS